MSHGSLSIVGLGPGASELLTQEAQAFIAEGERFYGYQPYIDRLALGEGQQAIASDNREEASRARQALDAALEGYRVVVVSGGDPGVFAMASAICEQIEAGPDGYRRLAVNVVPGITAMLAAAAACGAPLGHDFCCLSLSTNLKPWRVIEKRLMAAAEAGLAMAFYNPISRARPWQLGAAFDVLRQTLGPDTVVILARAISRSDQHIQVSTLAEVQPEWADMATLVIVGSAMTRMIERPEQAPLVYSPRHW